MRYLLLAVGTALLLNGTVLCFLANLNLGVILTVLLGVLFLGAGIFYKKLKVITKKQIPKIICIIVAIGILFEAGLISFIALYGIRDNVTFTEDAAVVLGAGIRGETVTWPLKMRLDKAVEFHQNNPNGKIVVTGGQGYQETVTEAYAMEKYLVSQGVDKSVIIKEEKATSTNENMRFSKEILDGIFEDDYKIAVITNNFHIYRGVQIAKNEGFREVTHLSAGLKWYNLIPCYIRESLAVLKLWVFD